MWKDAQELLPIELNYFYVPMIIVTIAVWIICSVFFGVYEMAVDTTFLCFRTFEEIVKGRVKRILSNAVEDCERNDGTPGKPYFMSKRLMEILNKKNQLRKGDVARADYGH